MLDIMRRQKRLKLVLWIVILGLALGMLLFFVPGSDMGGGETEGAAVTVDGNSVSMREYINDLRREYQRRRNNKTNPVSDEVLKSQLPQAVIYNLLSEMIRESLAKRLGVEVTPAEIEQAIKSHPAFQYQGNFVGVDSYKEVLARNYFTAAEFEEVLYQQLLEKKLQEILTDSLEVTDGDLREEFARDTQKTRVNYVLFKKDEYKKRVRPTEAELQSYFEAHKDTYRVMEKRRAQFLVVPAGQFLSGIAVSDQEIRAEWNKRPHEETVEAAHILLEVPDEAADAEVRAKAEEIAKRAKAGEDFSALAKKYSDDKGSAGRGGILPPFRRGLGFMSREFEAVAFSLKPDVISEPVRTQQGYEIIKVLKRTTPTIESMRAELTMVIQIRKSKELAKQKAEEAIPLLAKEKDLSQAGAKLGVQTEIKDLPPIGKNDPPSDFGITQDMRDALFEIKEANSIGKVVASTDGYAVPKLIEVQPPKPGEFASSRDKVEQAFIEAKAGELLQADAKKLSEEAAKQHSLEKAAKEMGLSVKESQEFTLSGTPDPEIGTNTPFNKAAFELDPGSISDPQPIYDVNRAVFQVISRTPFDESTYQKEKEELRNKLLASLRDPYYQDYLSKVTEEMQKKGDIEVNPKALELASKEHL